MIWLYKNEMVQLFARFKEPFSVFYKHKMRASVAPWLPPPAARQSWIREERMKEEQRRDFHAALSGVMSAPSYRSFSDKSPPWKNKTSS